MDTEVSEKGAGVAIRVRDLMRQITTEHELDIISGKVARDQMRALEC